METALKLFLLSTGRTYLETLLRVFCWLLPTNWIILKFFIMLFKTLIFLLFSPWTQTLLRSLPLCFHIWGDLPPPPDTFLGDFRLISSWIEHMVFIDLCRLVLWSIIWLKLVNVSFMCFLPLLDGVVLRCQPRKVAWQLLCVAPSQLSVYLHPWVKEEYKGNCGCVASSSALSASTSCLSGLPLERTLVSSWWIGHFENNCFLPRCSLCSVKPWCSSSLNSAQLMSPLPCLLSFPCSLLYDL